MPVPHVKDLLDFENEIWSQGFDHVAGIDEAGRGPLAGPVVSACVIFNPSDYIEGVYDSKALPAKTREILYQKIVEKAVCYGIGIVDNNTIDCINIFEATKISMQKALECLSISPDYIMVDAVKLKTARPCLSIIKGDQKSFTIAAASILAKVYRDNLMKLLHNEYPVYGWHNNKGYPTKSHRQAIKKFGFSPYHRRTFTVS